MMFNEEFEALLAEAQKLHHRKELSETVTPDYFEPGLMEYLDQSDGIWDAENNEMILRFEARGTRYDGRTEQIEKVSLGDPIRIVREKTNPFNSNNFTMTTAKEKNVGNMPAELCNVIAPLFDEGTLVIEHCEASYVEPISARSRYARQAVLFVELHMRILPPED